MKTIVTVTAALIVGALALWTGPAAGWASANRAGGSTSHSAGSTSHENRYGRQLARTKRAKAPSTPTRTAAARRTRPVAAPSTPTCTVARRPARSVQEPCTRHPTAQRPIVHRRRACRGLSGLSPARCRGLLLRDLHGLRRCGRRGRRRGRRSGGRFRQHGGGDVERLCAGAPGAPTPRGAAYNAGVATGAAAATARNLRDGCQLRDAAGGVDGDQQERHDLLPERQHLVPAGLWRERRLLPRRRRALTHALSC